MIVAMHVRRFQVQCCCSALQIMRKEVPFLIDDFVFLKIKLVFMGNKLNLYLAMDCCC